jgi:hypothetical protein
MSFLAPKPDLPNSSPERQSYEASGPVPVGFGRFRVGLKLLEAPFNHWQFNHGERKPKGNCYTLIAAGCHGPVKGIHRMWINGKPLWQFQATRSGGEFYRDFNYSYALVPWYARVYWGDPNQPVDPLLNGTALTLPNRQVIQPPRNPDGNVRVHPPYSGIFYVIFYSLHFDYPNDSSGQTSLPSIEAELLMEPPHHVGGSDWHTQVYGVNPIMAARALLADPIYGANLPDEMIPLTSPDGQSWTDKALALNDNGYHHQKDGAGGISPVWAENRSLAQTLSDLFSYYDGFLRLKNGVLLPDWFPNQAYDPGAVATLTRNDCLEEADVDPEGWEDTLSEMSIKYRSAQYLEEESITERSTYNLRVTDRGSRKTIDAPFIIHSTPARRMAQRELTIKAQPGFKARLKVMRERARNPDGSLLMPGNLVYLNYAPYALQMLCRIIEREDRRGEVTLSLVNERGKFAEDFVAAPDERQLPKIDDPGTVANWRILELPDELAGQGWPPKLAVLAQRPNASVLAAKCYLSKTGLFAGEEQELSSVSAFAVRAELLSALSDNATTMVFEDSQPDADLAIYRDYTAAEQANGYLLALIDNELISLGALGTTSGQEYEFAVARGMFGTTPAAHAGDATVWLFRRDWLSLITVEHELLRWGMPYTEAGATVYLRLAAATGWDVGNPNSPQSIVLRERASQDVPLPQFTVFAWRRVSSQPSAPSGGTYAEPAPTTSGWTLTQPSGTDPLWMSRRTYYSDQDPTTWTDPVRVTGQDGASPRVYSIVPSAAVIIFDDPDFDPEQIDAAGYVTVGNVRSVVSSQEAYIDAAVYRSTGWHQASMPYGMQAGDQRLRFRLEDEGTSAVLAEVIVPVITAGQTGPQGEPGQTGASTLMAFGRFLEQPAAPSGTGAPPNADWSLDSETAPGNAIYPLWVTVGTRPQGGLQWTWQLPFRFTPEKGDKGDQGDAGAAGTSTAHLTVYRRSSTLLSAAPTGGSYNFDTQVLAAPLNWSGEIPSGADALYASTSMAAVPGPSGVDNALTWTVPRKIAENGLSGISTAQVFAYKRSTNPSLLETPTGGSYNFGTKTLTAPSSPAGWQTTVPADPSAGLVYVSTATAAVIGQSGTDSALAWTQSRRLTDDMILPDGSIDASKLADNAVTTSKIAANAVVAAKIAAGAVTADKVAANAITADKVAAGAITADKIDVANLQAIKATTGHLTVDGSVKSGAYTAGQAGWKINADGTAEFNQIALRRGIINVGDILLHDPTNLAYNPLFVGGMDGWYVWNWHGDLESPAVGWFWSADVKQTGETTAYPGMWIASQTIDPDESIYLSRALLFNHLVIPVMPGDVLLAKARCTGNGVHVAIDWYDINQQWHPNTGTSVGNTVVGAWDTWEISEAAGVCPPTARYARIVVFKQGRYGHAGVSHVSLMRVGGGGVVTSSIPTPQIPQAQTFSGTLAVTRPTVPSGLTLRYSLNGAEVSRASPEWTAGVGNLSITGTATLRARYYNAYGMSGQEVSATYVLNAVQTLLPTPSIEYTQGANAASIHQFWISSATGFDGFSYRINGGTWVDQSGNATTWDVSITLNNGSSLELKARASSGYQDSSAWVSADYVGGGSGEWLEP